MPSSTKQPAPESGSNVVISFAEARARVKAGEYAAVDQSTSPNTATTAAELSTALNDLVRLGDKARSISDEIARFRMRQRL